MSTHLIAAQAKIEIAPYNMFSINFRFTLMVYIYFFKELITNLVRKLIIGIFFLIFFLFYSKFHSFAPLPLSFLITQLQPAGTTEKPEIAFILTNPKVSFFLSYFVYECIFKFCYTIVVSLWNAIASNRYYINRFLE